MVMPLWLCYKWTGFQYIKTGAKYKYVIKTSSLQLPLINMRDNSSNATDHDFCIFGTLCHSVMMYT
jgi:hypothetical protein